MMSKSLVATLLVGTARAGIREIKGGLAAYGAATGDRAFANSNLLEDFNGYGCWCYYEEHADGEFSRSGIGYGKGEPVNEYDAACKILHGGYECVVADQAIQGNDCTPWELGLYSGFNIGCIQSTGPVACCNADFGANTCKAQACAVEAQYLIDWLALDGSGVAKNVATFNHDQGFDPIQNCPVQRGIRNPDKQCCGNYPQRYPFKDLNGARKCCNKNGVGVTYNDNAWDCCDDGVGPNGCPDDGGR